MAVQPIPEGFHTVTPYLMAEDGDKLFAYIQQAFGAQEEHCSRHADGSVMHAQLRLGTSMIMLSQATAQWKAMPCSIFLYVENADAVYEQAIQAGGISVMAPSDQFYGDRMGGIQDPCGNVWWIATHIEDVSEDEMAHRQAEAGN